jgi:hypothetical protein
VRELVGAYYVCLRSALRLAPDLRRCLKHCRACGIFFLTSPSNEKRRDLRCPFGCRDAHRRGESSRRVAAYYGTPEGRQKKRALNRRRYEVGVHTAPEGPTAHGPTDESDDGSIMAYVCLLIWLISGRSVGREWVAAMHARIWRQHRLWQCGRFDYRVELLNKDPPLRP